jgi:hypothetical protein
VGAMNLAVMADVVHSAENPPMVELPLREV